MSVNMRGFRCLALLLCTIQASLCCIVTTLDQLPVAIEICDEIILDSLEVPPGETLKLHLRANTTVIFRGNTTFGYKEWEGPLVEVKASRVVIRGEADSILDGQGQLYWDGLGEWGSLKPRFFVIELHDSVMNNIHVLNNPIHCVNLTDSSNVTMDGWIIDASSGDPAVAGAGNAGHNTDGIDVFNTTNLVLRNGEVRNQDDCVCLRGGYDILVENFDCFGGHGLSISMGFGYDIYELNVLQNVVIRSSALIGGDNGIHIKTHVDAGLGLVQNVTYENINFEAIAKYGINIQENYRNLPPNSTFPDGPSNNIPIRNLTFNNIVGIVEPDAVPIYILCAEEGCFDWKFTNVIVEGTKENDCNYTPTGFDC